MQKSILVLIASLLVGALIVFVIFFAWQYFVGKISGPKMTVVTENSNVQNSDTETETMINETNDWKTYTSDNNYFSVQWPPMWKIETSGNYGIILSGKEGSLNIAWNGLGGACEPDKIKEVTLGENFYWVCGQELDGFYYSTTIHKTSNQDIAIGIIPMYSGKTDSERAVFLRALKSITLNPISQIKLTK